MNMNKSFYPILLLMLMMLPVTTWTQITFPALIGNNMVLQQKHNVPIWGWSTPNKRVTITPSWNNEKFSSVANGGSCLRLHLQVVPLQLKSMILF